MAVPGVQIVDSAGNSVSVPGGAVPVSGTVTTIPGGSGANVQQANTNTVIAAGTVANTTLRTGAGRLFAVTVTTVGTTAMSFTDNAVVIFTLSAAQVAALGTYQTNIPFFTNLVAVGAATNPGVTVSFGF